MRRELARRGVDPCPETFLRLIEEEVARVTEGSMWMLRLWEGGPRYFWYNLLTHKVEWRKPENVHVADYNREYDEALPNNLLTISNPVGTPGEPRKGYAGSARVRASSARCARDGDARVAWRAPRGSLETRVEQHERPPAYNMRMAAGTAHYPPAPGESRTIGP